MKDIKTEIDFLTELGFSSAEIYEILVMETIEKASVENAIGAKNMMGLDSWHTAAAFGYFL